MAEIREILAAVPDLELVDLDAAGVAPSPAEEGLEPHETFEENALSKARYFFELTGLPTVADDSAGPLPVSCRSEVNGIPEIRAPR